MRNRITMVIAGVTACLLVATTAGATPVAKTKAEREAMGRSFLEPLESTNFIQLGTEAGDKEFAPAFQLLEKLFPRYAEYTTVHEELNDPNAVSVGEDGFPAWDKRDTKDGLPFDVAYVTDKTVPDHKKEYVLFTVAHSAEPCGR